MASSLLVHLQERQVSLLQALITRIFDLQPGDANFGTVLDYATRHLSPKHHSFPTVHPSKVHECYTDLEERLAEHAQFSKLQALRYFRWRLCQLQLQGSSPDLDWSILSLLFSLATRPLDTQYPPTQLPHPAPQHLSAPDPGPRAPDPGPGAGSDNGTSSETESEAAWDSASSLSDWSSTNTEPGPETNEDVPDQPMQPPGLLQGQQLGRVPAHEGASTWSRMAAALRALDPTSAAAAAQLPGSSIGPARSAPASSPSDLVLQLREARLGVRRPLGGLREEECCSGGYLVHQALLLLLGSQSQAFQWQARPGRFVPRKGLHVAYLSPTQLQGVLGKFAEAGTQVHLLRSLCSLPPGEPLLLLPAAATSSAPSSGLSPRPCGPRAALATPCLRAYLTAMHAQLQRLMRPLVAMQQTNMHASTTPSPSAPQPRPFTLLELLDLTEAARHRIQLLYLSTRAVTDALPTVPGTQVADPLDSPRSSSAAGQGSQASPRGTATPKARVLLSPGAKGRGSATAAAAPRFPPPPLLLADKAAAAGSAAAAAAAGAAAAALQRGDAARTSSVLLDVLFQQLQQFGPLGGPANCSDHQVLLYLYLCTLVPLLEGLQSWLYNSDGQEDQLAHDFFIRAADRSISETDPSYWSAAYTLVGQQQQQQQQEREDGGVGGAGRDADGGQSRAEPGARQSASGGAGPADQAPAAACPSYLQPMAPSILAAGKLLRLLRSIARQSTQPAPRASASGRAPPTGLSTPRAALRRSLLHDHSPGDSPGDRPALRRASAPGAGGGGAGGSGSLCQSFLDNLHGYLSAYNDNDTSKAAGGRHYMAPGATDPAALRHPSPSRAGGAAAPQGEGGATGRGSGSYFALMALAGESLGRLEPWLPGAPSSGGGGPRRNSRQGRDARELPPPPSVPWLPPWLPPSEQPDLASWRRGGDGVSRQDQAWGGCGAGREEAAAGQLPSAPALSRGATEAEGAGEAAGDAVPAAAAPSGDAMDVTEWREAEGSANGADEGGGGIGGGLEAGPGPRQEDEGGAPKAEGERGVDGHDLPGLEEWGRQVRSGLCGRQGRQGGWGRLEGAGGIGKLATGLSAGGGPELQRLQASLLPRVVGQPAGDARGRAGGRRAREQLQWEALSGPSQQQVLHRMEWLLEGGRLRLPPIQMLLQRCLLPLLSRRVEVLNRRLLRCLLSDWGLHAELLQLRNFYLLASPAMQAWAGWLLGSLLRGRMVEECQEHELEAALQEAVAARAGECDAASALPPLDSMSVSVDARRAARARDKQVEATRRAAASFSSMPAGPEARGGAGGAGGAAAHPSERKQNHCLAELDGLQLRCQSSWLLAMIGGNEAMESYGQAMVFLLQIQLGKMALEATRQRCWKLFQRQARWGGGTRGQAASVGVLGVLYGPAAAAAARALQRPGAGAGAASAVLLGQRDEEAVQQEMVNFVTNLHQFVLDRLLLNAWVHLERGLAKVRSLDEVAALHKQFVADLDQQCGRGGAAGSTQKHISAAIIRVLDQVVRFCSAHKNAAEAAEALAETAAAAAAAAVTAAAAARRSGGLMTRSQLQLQEQLSTARKIMADAASQFKQLLLYLLRVLHAAALKARSRTEFEHLLSSINHNGFYDSQLLMPE